MFWLILNLLLLLGQAEIMPKKGDQIEFNGWNKKFQSNVTGFLDFETVQIDDPKNPEIKNP